MTEGTRRQLWRRALWWFYWQVQLFGRPPGPPDRAALGRWAWGRLGFFVVAYVAHIVFWTSVGIVVAWAR